jgi:hypothetical protein
MSRLLLTGVGGSGTFQPLNLASCVGQYDLNTPNQATLATWVDAAGVMGDFTQATGSRKPSTDNSGRVVFDGVDDEMGLAAGWAAGTSHTIAISFANAVGGATSWLMSGGGADQQLTAGVAGSSYIVDGGTINTSVSGGGTAAQKLVIVRNGTSLKSFVDGVQYTSVSVTNATGYIVNYLGDWVGGTQPFDGNIVRMAFFNAALSDADRALVEGWL